MKTPVQDLIEKLKSQKERQIWLMKNQLMIDTVDAVFTYAIETAESMLEKEKEVMCKFAEFIAEDHWRLHNVDYQINLYEWKHAEGDVKTTHELFQTFNTKEK